MILTCVFWPDKNRSIARTTAFGVVLSLFGGICSSIQWIGKWNDREDYSFSWDYDYEFRGSARLLPLLLNIFITCVGLLFSLHISSSMSKYMKQ